MKILLVKNCYERNMIKPLDEFVQDVKDIGYEVKLIHEYYCDWHLFDDEDIYTFLRQHRADPNIVALAQKYWSAQNFDIVEIPDDELYMTYYVDDCGNEIVYTSRTPIRVIE